MSSGRYSGSPGYRYPRSDYPAAALIYSTYGYSMSRYVSHDDSPRQLRGEKGGTWGNYLNRQRNTLTGSRTGIEMQYSVPGTAW